jgi:hypothetical protein
MNDLDKRKFCGHCGRLFKIPDAEQMQKAMETAKSVGKSVYIDEQGRIYG